MAWTLCSEHGTFGKGREWVQCTHALRDHLPIRDKGNKGQEGNGDKPPFCAAVFLEPLKRWVATCTEASSRGTNVSLWLKEFTIESTAGGLKVLNSPTATAVISSC